MVACPKSCLHNASCGSENDPGSGGLAQRRVKFFFRKGEDINLLSLDQPADFPGGQHIVHILHAAVIHGWEICLLLFGHAGHNGNAGDIVRIHAKLSGEKALRDCAEHLLR